MFEAQNTAGKSLVLAPLDVGRGWVCQVGGVWCAELVLVTPVTLQEAALAVD